MLEIVQFTCRDDNFGVLLHDAKTGNTAAIDAPALQPILALLEERGWTLTHIFTTHHHIDHVEANLDLKARFGVKITGPATEASKIPGIDKTVSGGDSFDFAGHRIDVIDCPSHTLGGISYSIPSQKLLFAADTLFSLGCGRLLEGTPDQMWESLTRLMAQPGKSWTSAEGVKYYRDMFNNAMVVANIETTKSHTRGALQIQMRHG